MFMDFNQKGFDSIDMVHQKLFGHKHNRGLITENEINKLMSELFEDVRLEKLELNNIWVCLKAK